MLVLQLAFCSIREAKSICLDSEARVYQSSTSVCEKERIEKQQPPARCAARRKSSVVVVFAIITAAFLLSAVAASFPGRPFCGRD